MPSPPRLDDQLCFAVYAASRAITQSYLPFLKELGLTYPQYLVMMVLWENDDVTVSEVGERLMLDSGTLTPVLKRLERAKLVSRKRDAVDERRVRIRLSTSGKALGRKAAKKHDALLCLLGPKKKELSVLRDQLQTLTQSIRAD
ncbi:MAG: MarR family transcriptional regulator [Deltaproteobacteria bacterium]|nr:MarR family transcriptional regulator [Deltaproteobacteria bacterium]